MIKNPEIILAGGRNLTTDGQRCAVKELISSYYYPSESYIDPLKVTLVYNFVQDNVNRALSVCIYSNEYFEYYIDMGPWDVAHSTIEIMDAIRKYINNGCKFEFQDKREEKIVTTRNFNASTKRQNRAVDAILTLGFFPSDIKIKSYDIQMQYNYKDLSNENSLLIITVSPSGEYELASNAGLDNEITEIFTIESIVTYFQTQMARGYKFDFQDKGEEDMLDFIENNAEKRLENIYKRLNGCGYGGKYSISNNLLSISSSLGDRINKSVWVYVEYEGKNKIKSEIYIDGELKSAAFSFYELFNSLRFYEIYGGCANNHKEDNKVETYTMNDAAKMALSEDYKERFIAEYIETKIRYERLYSIIIKWCAGKADFVTDIDLLEEQAKHMGNYLKTLEIRAVKEDIELPDVDWRK